MAKPSRIGYLLPTIVSAIVTCSVTIGLRCAGISHGEVNWFIWGGVYGALVCSCSVIYAIYCWGDG